MSSHLKHSLPSGGWAPTLNISLLRFIVLLAVAALVFVRSGRCHQLSPARRRTTAPVGPGGESRGPNRRASADALNVESPSSLRLLDCALWAAKAARTARAAWTSGEERALGRTGSSNQGSKRTRGRGPRRQEREERAGAAEEPLADSSARSSRARPPWRTPIAVARARVEAVNKLGAIFGAGAREQAEAQLREAQAAHEANMPPEQRAETATGTTTEVGGQGEEVSGPPGPAPH